MPIYEYECAACGRRSEAIQRLNDPPHTECEECGGELRRLISAPAVQFKGSGWYVTDYAGKGNGGSESKEPKSGDSPKSESSQKATADSSSSSSGASE